jgi:hypothetical protein
MWQQKVRISQQNKGQLENLRAFNAIIHIKTNAAHVTPLMQEIRVPFIIHGT